MRTRFRNGIRYGVLSLAVAAASLVAPRLAHAETDAFGIGDGHRGAYAAAGADEVVNSYAPLTNDAAAGATTLTFGTVVGDAAGFAPNDLVMIWRATGLPAAEAPSGVATMIPLATAGGAGGPIGRFELARVQAVDVGASTLTLTKPLTRAFAAGVAQVIRVPEFTTVSIPPGTSIVAAPWSAVGSGFAGGIVVFLANGTVTVEGAISADARGFRGGRSDESLNELALSCPNADGVETQGYAAKGEGLVATAFGGAANGGRGNRANGAGGGNCVENGGGGGGHAALGGGGGRAVLNAERGGQGGAPVEYALLERLAMGGGGGAGEQKNGVGSGGGNGGGVVFVRARAIAGAGAIRANGEAAANAGILGVESDGAGGGGAGGSILLRAVDTIACGSAQTRGGKGGDTAVVGLGTFGPGGGGSGGRVLLQGKATAACPVDVAPGAPGAAGIGGERGATAGGNGETQPGPPGTFCFSNPEASPQCADPTPVCDVAIGACQKCSGPFGGGSPLACPVAVEPVCAADGSCNPCDGDQGSGAARACQLTTSPHCFLAGPNLGACGRCTTDADCTGRSGTRCNATAGRCGTACTNDAECKTGEWCAQNVCIPKTPNGESVPAIPPIDGECTPAKGQRVCLSSVCEADDDRCGLRNGSPCEGIRERCRSTVCFPKDRLCGTPTGEPCGTNGECRSELCRNGVCAGCDDDKDCGASRICDVPKNECVPGCREVNGVSTCETGTACSRKDGAVGECVPAGGAALPLDAGLIEGGGCACRTTLPGASSPAALAAAALGVVLALSRRRTKTRDDDANAKDEG